MSMSLTHSVSLRARAVPRDRTSLCGAIRVRANEHTSTDVHVACRPDQCVSASPQRRKRIGRRFCAFYGGHAKIAFGREELSRLLTAELLLDASASLVHRFGWMHSGALYWKLFDFVKIISNPILVTQEKKQLAFNFSGQISLAP